MTLLMISIGIGLVVSLLFVDHLGLMTGGMVVPGYLALAMNHPITILLTLLDALLIFGLVRLLSRFLIVYGRRRIALIFLLAFLSGMLFRAAFSTHFATHTFGDNYTIVGYIIPGLIALSMDRQGIIETTTALLSAATLVRLILILLLGNTLLL